MTVAELKDFALRVGADDIGIGNLTRFEGAPAEMDPRNIYPGAKSLIGLVFRIPRGYIRGIEQGTNFYQYPSLGIWRYQRGHCSYSNLRSGENSSKTRATKRLSIAIQVVVASSAI